MRVDHSTHLEGTVADIFAHRFVLQTANGRVLADLTPHGAARVALRSGDVISIDGEQKPSEIKVSRLVRGTETFDLGPGEAEHGRPDLDKAKRIVADAGYRIIGEPRPGPKHYEFLGEKDGAYSELHIHFDGLRHVKPVAPSDPKWADSIRLS